MLVCLSSGEEMPPTPMTQLGASQAQEIKPFDVWNDPEPSEKIPMDYSLGFGWGQERMG